jgi:hypothetical protein
VLVVIVAFAIVDIQHERIRDPVLVALAAGGLVVYGIIGWVGWWAVRRFWPRARISLLFVSYSVAMGLFFFIATVIYLVIAHYYRGV